MRRLDGPSVRLLSQYFVNHREQSRVVHGLWEKTGGSADRGSLKNLLRREGSDKNDRNGPSPKLDRLEQRKTVHARHVDIGDDKLQL